MDRALDLAESLEDGSSAPADAVREVGTIQECEDLAERSVRAVVGVVVVDDDVGPGGPHATALDPLEHEGVPVDVEPADHRGDEVGVRAGIDQGGHRHVAGDARLTVEPGNPTWSRHRAGHVKMRAIAQAAPKPLSMPTTVTPLAHDACMASSAVTPSRPAP